MRCESEFSQLVCGIRVAGSCLCSQELIKQAQLCGFPTANLQGVNVLLLHHCQSMYYYYYRKRRRFIGYCNLSPPTGSGPFLWEASPWSGPGGVSVGAGAATAASGDRQWTAAAASSSTTGRFAPFDQDSSSSLPVDDCSADVIAARVVDAKSNEAVLLPYGELRAEAMEMEEEALAARSWILVHDLPPLVSLDLLQMVISTALRLQAAAAGDGHTFEMHPHLTDGWVLVSVASAHLASIVHVALDSSGGSTGEQGGGGAHYGSVTMLSPTKVMHRLQQIQVCP